MATNTAPGDLIQVLFMGTWHGQQVQNKFDYTVLSVSGQVPYSTFQNAVANALVSSGTLASAFIACVPPEYALTNVVVQTIWPSRVLRTFYPTTLVGTFSGHSSTANLASVITRQSYLASKQQRSSIHIPLANLDTGISNGLVSTAQLTANTTLATAMKAVNNVASLGVISPVIVGAKTPQSPFPLVATITQSTVRVMRRRTVGVGK